MTEPRRDLRRGAGRSALAELGVPAELLVGASGRRSGRSTLGPKAMTSRIN